MSSTIALRYANIRSQFKYEDNIERTIIDYQLQKNKIYPIIAKAYALLWSAEKIQEIVKDNFQRVQKEDYSLMKEVHVLLSGTKFINYILEFFFRK